MTRAGTAALVLALLGTPMARAEAWPLVGADDVKRLAAVVVDATPRSIVTVPVAIPESLRDLGMVSYEVRLLSGASAVGRTTGALSTPQQLARPLLLSLRVPSVLPAGPLEIAEVEFRGGGRTAVVQPIVVRIPAERALLVTGTREVVGLRAGDRVELAYRVLNEGNGPETLSVAVRVPKGWSQRPAEPERLVVLPPRRQSEIAVLVGIPLDAGIGDHYVEASATPLSGALAARVFFRTMLRVNASATTSQGLTLTPVVALAASSAGAAAFAGATLDGPVTEEISVRARFLPQVRHSGIVTQGLAGVGAFGAPFAASVSGKTWDISAGNALNRLSDLAGVNVIGQGVAAQGTRGSYEARAFAGRPVGAVGATGTLIGAGLWRDGSFGRFGGAASHLVERGGVLSGRQLTAVTADFESEPLGTLRLGGALGYRSGARASGAGVAMSATHERSGERVHLRVVHAPGGSAAFARATDELELQASRLITGRWSVDAALSRTSDVGAVFRSLRTSSYIVGQRFDLSPAATLSLRGQLSSFAAEASAGDLGDFGAGDRAVTGGYEWRRGPVALSAEGSIGAVTRRTELLGGRVSEQVAGQQAWRLHATRALRTLGALDASAGLQLTEAGVGLPSDIWYASARWSAIPVTVGGRAARLETEAEYQRLGTLQSFFVTRASFVVGIAGGFDLALSAERNPYFRDAQGRAGWIAAMRVSAATRVRAAAALGPEGVVYEDRNLNGRRDEREPGVGGVRLRRGDARTETDARGRYRLPSRARGRTRVEQGSLPVGLLAHPLLAADTLERADIPLLTTGTAILTLHLFADEEGRVPDVNIAMATVVLRDQTGFEWVGRRTSDSTVAFEDVPVGTYVPRFDFTRLREPLRLPEGLSVTIESRQRREVEVGLRGRVIRVIVPPSRSGAPRSGNQSGR